MPRIRTIAAALFALSLTAAVTGCAATPSQPSQTPAAQQPAAPAAPAMTAEQIAQEVASIASMSPEAKRAALADFPMEVPIPDGTFVRAMTQSADAWDYELVVEASAPAVVQWYADRFTGKSWQIVDSGSTAKGGAYVVLRKNQAEARFEVNPGEMQGTAVVVGVVGLGAPVTQVQ